MPASFHDVGAVVRPLWFTALFASIAAVFVAESI